MSSDESHEGKQPPHAMILLVIIGVLSAFFIIRGFDAYIGGQFANSMGYFLLGLFGVSFILLMVNRFAGKFGVIPPRVTLTLLQCTSCAFKSIRNFQLGDYIPKPMGACPSCGGPFIIEAIYSQERVPSKKKESSV